MSASKKKRLGSQRRSLNPNLQESPESSDKAMSPPAPQGRQRADANADLTLSPGSAESETSARKKKLGSQRGNKGKLQFKDVTTESSHKPIEEVEGSTTRSEALDALGIKNESIDESLERNIKSMFPESEADSDLVLNDATNVSLSEAMSQKSDIQDTDTRSDLLLKVAESAKYLPEIDNPEEGVLSEKDQAQQMPDIFQATIPAGVTGESSVRLIEHEEINVIGSHDCNNKHDTENKAGPTEKPVCQESDKSSLPTAKPRKMGSSRRKKVINVQELQDQATEMAMRSNIPNALETAGLTIVDSTQEVNVCVSATEVTYKEKGQIDIKLSPKINEEKMDTDDLSDVASANLLEVKEFGEPHIGNVLVEMKAQGDLIQETELRDEQSVCLQNKDLSELSFAEIPPTDDTPIPVTSPHYFVTDIAVEDAEAQILETGENSTPQVPYKSDETNKDITNKESFKTTEFAVAVKDDPHPKDNFATNEENKERSEKEVKDEILVSCSLSSELLSDLESDKSPVTELQFTKDETGTELSEPMLNAQPGIHPSTEGLLYFDKNEEYNLLNDTIVGPLDKAASSFLCVTPEDNSFVESADGKNVNIIEKPEPLISFIDGASIVSGQDYKGEAQDKNVHLSDEQQSLPIPQSVDNAPLSTPNVSVIYVEEAKILEVEESSSQPVCDESLQHHDEIAQDNTAGNSLNTTTAAAVVQEPIIESDLTENTNFDFYANEHNSDKSSVTKDMSELDEGKVMFKTNIEDVENINILGPQLEPLTSFTDVHRDSSEPHKKEDQEIKLSHEQLVDLQKDMSSEPEWPLNSHTEEINAPLTSPFPDIAASVDDVTATWDVQDEKKDVITTPNIVIEEIEVESVLEEQSPEMSINNKNQAAGPDKIDKASVQVHDESTDNEDLKYTSKLTDETWIVEIDEISDSQQSTEQPVNNETIGEPFENVQKLDVEVNAPDTAARHGPERRKFGSSRRSKARKDVTKVTTDGSEDAQFAENDNLPSSKDVQTDEQSEPVKKQENISVGDAVGAAVIELSSANEETELNQMKEKLIEVEGNILDLDENVSRMVEDGISESTEQCASKDFALSEVEKDEYQQRENDETTGQSDESSELFTVQIPHRDHINATLATTQPDVTVSVEDDTALGSQPIGNRRKLGSTRKIKGRRQNNNEPKPEEISIMPDGKNAKPEIDSVIEEMSQEMTIENEETQLEPVQRPEIAMDNENQAAVQDELGKSLIQVHDEALETVVTNDESLKPTEVTAVLEAEQTAEDEIANITDNQVLDNVILEQTAIDSQYRQETCTESKDNTEQSEVNTEGYALKEPINVHQLTYISDSETHEEMDNSSLQQAKQPVFEKTKGEPSENVKLNNTEVNTSDTDAHHGLRKKLGSSRRVKGRKLEVIPTDSKDALSNDNEDASQVSETVEACQAEEQISTDFVSELEAEPMDQGNFSKSENTELLSDKDKTVDSTQETEIKTQVVSLEEKAIIDIQKEIPEVVADSFTLKDLKDKGVVEAEGLPRDVDIDNTSSQSVAGSEEIISAKIDDPIQSVGMSAADKTKEQEGNQVMEVSESSAKLQIYSEPKRKKMGSTRRSQLNRKQQDEERNTDNATIFVKATIDEKDNTPTVSEVDAQPLSSDIFVNQGESAIAASPAKDQHQSEESTDRQEVTQEDKEKILQEADLVEDIDKGATIQTVLPIASEEIQPSSPGKRRKMGSTRKNLSSKRESPQEQTVTPVILEREVVASISNDNNESKEHSGLLVYTSAVHEPPPDEETPLSQQVSQEKLRSVSKETELSSQPEAMAEDAAVARRRKMGSHRKPHSDQSIMQRRVTDSEESMLHPLGEHRIESPKLTQISEVNKGDNKALSSATGFNIKLDSSEKISQQPSPSSTNVHRVQESNIRIAAGYDRSANRYEVVMIGDSSVGKTSFIQRAQSGKFSPDVPASIGMDSYKWTVIVNGKTAVLHLWDTAGQERFRSMTKQIFHRAQAFLLMYDVTCAQTFTAVSYWASCIKDGAAENVVVLLLGNKSDRTERKVTREEGELLAEENSFAFMECSAATGENVIEALETVARMLSQKADRSEEPLMLRKPEPKKSGCC